ncbi:MAG: hypothetical protein HQK78_13680 [Desulfobacterales bacterium]|nr:hypothetical protein [Desulfobacterales bacterium]
MPYKHLLDRIYGSGDVSTAKIWFVGIEEAAEWSLQYINSLLSNNPQPWDFEPVARGSIINEKLKYGASFTKVYDIMSKIIVGLGIPSYIIDWKDYRDHFLFQNSTEACHLNLFPLGAKNIKIWPSHYTTMFEFKNKNTYYNYINKSKRWNEIDAKRKLNSPLLICFGKEQYKHFKKCFFIINKSPDDTLNDIEFYLAEKIILTPFFFSTFMPDALIDKLINKINAHNLNPLKSSGIVGLFHRTLKLYQLNITEQNLVNLVFDEFRLNGFAIPTTLPEIYMSDETPPMMKNHGINPNYESKYDIEKLLGCYEYYFKRIIIYEKGIDSLKGQFNQQWLTSVVLIHELGHWITHQLPTPKTSSWQINHYAATDTNVHEGWAQLICQWIAGNVKGNFAAIFNQLNKRQSSPYHIYKALKKYQINRVIDSLDKLRKFGKPASLKDWFTII